MNDINNTYETEINLVDLLFYLLKQWKMLVVALVIGALIGTMVCTYKNNQNAKLIENMQSTSTEISIDVVDKNLLADMEVASQYRKLYEKQLEYNNSSLLMQLNPNDIYQGTIQYYISGGQNTSTITRFYESILSNELAQNIIDTADIDTEPQYILELVEYNSENIDDVSIYLNGNSYDLSNSRSIVTFEVNTGSNELAELILESIKDAIASLKQEIVNSYGVFETNIIAENISRVVNSDLQALQKNNTDLLNSYNNTFKSLEKNFTGDDLNYYQAVFLEKAIQQETEINIPKESIIKWLLIGMLLSIMCWGVYGVFKYMTDKKIKTVDELKGRYGLTVIGFLNVSNKQKGIDGFIDYLRVRSNGAFDVIYSIQSIISQNTLLSIETRDIKVNDIAKNLGVSNNLIINCLHINIADVKNIDEVDEVILVSKLYDTSYDDIEKDINVCKLRNISIKGIIIIA